MPVTSDPDPVYAIIHVPAGQLRPWRVDSMLSLKAAKDQLKHYKQARAINCFEPRVQEKDTWCIVRVDSKPEWGELCP